MTDSLSADAASAAVADIGWRLILGALCCQAPVNSLDQGLAVATAARFACGEAADGQLRVDVRSDEVSLTLQDEATGRVLPLDVELARSISDALLQLGVITAWSGARRSVQLLEIAIDTMDRSVILPFWRAVLGYADQSGADDAVIDPLGQGPSIWFQQLDEPRTQRNRIHFDIAVPHDEAEARIEAALAAGGHLVSDAEARAFWILADADGNEVCVCTWQDRD